MTHLPRAPWLQHLPVLRVLPLLVGLGGCFTQLTVLDGPDGGSAITGDPRLMDGNTASTGSAGSGGAGSGSSPDAGPGYAVPSAELICVNHGACRELLTGPVDRLDLLFVVDNSGSMIEEQAALRAQFPRLIEALTSGQGVPGSSNPFPPLQDVHVAVVSSDMGTVGVSGIPACTGFGDDGVMRDPLINHCTGSVMNSRFVEYMAGTGFDPFDFASGAACLADLGTGGCGFEQPLEAALKALWPKVDQDSQTHAVIEPNRISFLEDATGQGVFGHGDQENTGFLRADTDSERSMVAVVVLSDEDDCSTSDPTIFTPQSQLAQTDPNYNVDLNLRCLHNPQSLYSIQDRYVKALKTLRKGREDLVLYGAVVGVPQDLVNNTARQAVDFSNDAERDNYYDSILHDSRMLPTADPTADPGNGHLLPSCDTSKGLAYPPVRMVQLAKAFGENGFVQSLCDEDFAPVTDRIVEAVARRANDACFETVAKRNAMGGTSCDLIWELPAPGRGPAAAPTACDQLPALLRSDARYSSPMGVGELCLVSPASAAGSQPEVVGEGWYYDDFSDALASECKPGTARIGYTPTAKPPLGVRAYLDCHADALIID